VFVVPTIKDYTVHSEEAQIREHLVLSLITHGSLGLTYKPYLI